jgi:hypothetical protein
VLLCSIFSLEICSYRTQHAWEIGCLAKQSAYLAGMWFVLIVPGKFVYVDSFVSIALHEWDNGVKVKEMHDCLMAYPIKEIDHCHINMTEY